MKFRLSFRFLCGLGVVGCCVLLGLAYLLQYGYQLAPCPLCLFQRYVLWIIAVVFLAAMMCQKTVGRIFYSVLILLLSGVGILLAGRQLWLQHLPLEQMPACTAGLERLLAYHSVFETFGIVLTGSGECGLVEFRILGLSLAAWSFMAFIVIMLSVIIMLVLQKKRRI